jgi:ABC-type multidrug transport system ATPase subunit
MTLGIEVQDLTVRFGDVAALDELSLQFESGKIHGLLGRNGAGKSTLLAALAAYRRPTSGRRPERPGRERRRHHRLLPDAVLCRSVDPGATMPDAARYVADFTPIGAASEAIADAWSGAWPTPLHLAVLAGWAVVASAAAARLFRWE